MSEKLERGREENQILLEYRIFWLSLAIELLAVVLIWWF